MNIGVLEQVKTFSESSCLTKFVGSGCSPIYKYKLFWSISDHTVLWPSAWNFLFDEIARIYSYTIQYKCTHLTISRVISNLMRWCLSAKCTPILSICQIFRVSFNLGKIRENVDKSETVKYTCTHLWILYPSLYLWKLAYETKDYIIVSCPRNTANQTVTHAPCIFLPN